MSSADDPTSPSFDRSFWDRRWAEVLDGHADQVARMPANAHLTAVAADLAPGRALDAGCGHGAETIWLAGHGWQVTAADFAAAALAHGRSTAERLGADIAGRISWVEADLGVWAPEPERYDLVASLYVHVAGAVEEMVARSPRAWRPAAHCCWSATSRSTRSPVRRRRPPARRR